MMSEILEINKEIGWWTLLEKTEQKSYDNTFFWKCKCRCGLERLVTERALKFKMSKSCGCTRFKHNRREKFFQSKYKILDNGCWEWQGSRDKDGYSLFGVNQKGYRYSYEKYKGKIPENMCVCHTCDNRGCVNPEHLWLGSNVENQIDKIKKKRQSKGGIHGSAILKENQVIEIRKKLEMGKIPLDIAKEYGVNRETIYAIRSGRIWKHI